ncbi:MAG TPA: 50S ribosomal protein L29 [Haliscomenobacter sp.]|uniref:Large ribosomal subunit protein uL29 n=1 Tax=Haliscomenobacter hydrossis (strain ATCC 27775 / DSM 1100 / LMG 10767 / O) TaxID=760192 RepID=F4KWV1_HALH1|nr:MULTISPECIES: 50S ribosomal protein L29 [Haliscomenobacter]AEE52584.1 ribosomal protein L29 [Haliscomenobacter hydrossis DSM 1100]MBK9491508.1 50S ribosomal protein L29 [Haliscomenobacter sp.]HOY18316.1 50S ribosomal protein L29 [Haliscomenobacter sp.]HPH18870.1 50S ribosomal protein L29 [Haliscomenobacter sp.]
MANSNLEELKGLADEALQAELDNSESLYRKMKFEHAIKGLANPMELRDLRRAIARLNTEVRRRIVATMGPEELALRTKIRARRRRKQ